MSGLRVWGALALVAVAGCGDSGGGSRDATTDTDGVDAVDGVDSDVADDADVAADVADADVAADAADADVPLVFPPDRSPGARAPLTARCDDSEPTRCLLPWPSSVFLAKDATTATGVRLQLDATAMPDQGVELMPPDADGFSRVTPILTVLPYAPGAIMAVFSAEPDSAGEEVPLDSVIVPGRSAADPTTIVGYSLAPLRPATEYFAVVLRSTIPTDTTPIGEGPARDAAQVALGLRAPSTQADADRYAYYAPERAVIAALHLDTDRVIALWDFVTRSADDPRAPLKAMADAAKAAVDDGTAQVVITSAVPGDGPKALIVEGRIDGLSDASVAPAVPYSAPFRVVLPANGADYHVVMYGHGTGGDVHETSFDDLIAGSGAAKVNTEIDGWTGDTVAAGLGGLLTPIVGTHDLVARMRRSIAGIAAIQRAVLGDGAAPGPLGEVLAAATVLDTPNPAAGHHALADSPIWAGGSLGGVIGCVYGHLEPTIAGGILNVPGAAFTHWLARSSLGGILDLALANKYPAMVDQQLVAALSQELWDEVDGAIWADARAERPIFIIQMSVGDPVMPNNATAMVATALHALMLLPAGGTAMVPVPGLDVAEEAVARSALTEFKTNETDNTAIHGFAARGAPAGAAARAQFQAFIATLWAGAPLITIPDACAALPVPGVCDFSGIPLGP